MLPPRMLILVLPLFSRRSRSRLENVVTSNSASSPYAQRAHGTATHEWVAFEGISREAFGFGHAEGTIGSRDAALAALPIPSGLRDEVPACL